MPRKRDASLEMKSVLFIDAVNYTEELKTYDRSLIIAKINQLREFVEFFFIYKLKGLMIGELGDGFLILCPPEPHKVLNEAFALMAFVRAYNYRKDIPSVLNVRIAIHYGLIAPPEGDNYIDSNINLASRLEGKTPPNCICVSSVVHDIVSDTLRHYDFTEVKSKLKGFGHSKFYFVSSESETLAEPSRGEERLGFYLSTIDALRRALNWSAVRNTCMQALLDFKGNPEFTYQLGIANMVLKEYKNAIAAFQDCVRMNYKLGGSLLFTGRAYQRLGNIPEAIVSFKKAFENEPDHFHAMTDLAEIYLQMREYDEVWSLASRASKLAPMYYSPRALLISLVIFQQRKRSIENLIKGVPDWNRERFRSDIEEHLKTLGVVKYRNQLNAAFKSVYGVSFVKGKRSRKSRVAAA